MIGTELRRRSGSPSPMSKAWARCPATLLL